MEMNKKYARTTQAQLRWYIAFCKDHPELMQGKNCPKSPNQIQDSWKEISTNLNSMVGPARTPDAWRESLRNWRKQSRARVRKLISERRRTGAGVNPVAELTDFEQQALETFGIAAVEGHSNSRLGFNNESNAENISPAPEVGPRCADHDELIGDEDAEDISNFCIVMCESPSHAPLSPAPTNPVPSSCTSLFPVTPNPVRTNSFFKSRASLFPTTPNDVPTNRAASSPATINPVPNSEASLESGTSNLASSSRAASEFSFEQAVLKSNQFWYNKLQIISLLKFALIFESFLSL
ncbi:uncharacterized protein [Eurosta solidaginis]|uniref:uncharacterized protein n=1 Tax=Eurosta solidaginis TaxID=178769 RepID=UPI0035317A97